MREPKNRHCQGRNEQEPWGPAGAVPIVGTEMLRRFTMTFDVRRGLVYLDPNASLSEPVPAPN